MRMVAVLANKEHPELGAISIPIPIRTGEYRSVMKMLRALGIGDVSPPEEDRNSGKQNLPS